MFTMASVIAGTRSDGADEHASPSVSDSSATVRVLRIVAEACRPGLETEGVACNERLFSRTNTCVHLSEGRRGERGRRVKKESP
jgi:hypothetical protein